MTSRDNSPRDKIAGDRSSAANGKHPTDPQAANLQGALSNRGLFVGDQSHDEFGFERDLLIDALLEESLGGHAPPDFSQRILARLATQAESAAESSIAATSPAIHSPATAQPEQAPQAASRQAASRRAMRPIPLSAEGADSLASGYSASAPVRGASPQRRWSVTSSRRLAWAGVAAAVALLVGGGLWLRMREPVDPSLVQGQPGENNLGTTGPIGNAPSDRRQIANDSGSGTSDSPMAAPGIASHPVQPESPGTQINPGSPLHPEAPLHSEARGTFPSGVASSSPEGTSEPRGNGQPHPPLPRGIANNGSEGDSPRQPSTPGMAPESAVAGSTPSPGAPNPATTAGPGPENSSGSVVSSGGAPRGAADAAGSLLLSHDDDAVLDFINHQIRQRWQEAGVSPSPPAADAEWCRRVYLDLIGRIPTIYEMQDFLSNRSPLRRQELVDRLLAGEEYLEEYARNWSNVWSNLLLGRSNDNELVDREGFQQYLRRTFLTNKPYDQFVSELLTATGANTPGASDFNGAVNYLLDNLQENATPATAKTARIFLGVQVQCTQCHNHPFYDAKQNQFWELNAFFRQARPVTARENGVAVTRLVDADFAGEGNTPSEAEIYYELRNGLMKTAYPVFITGEQIPPSGLVSDVNRRRELAALATSSSMFRKAIVNRIWSHFLGYGFTRPIDDMGPHNAASHPELLEQLSSVFAQSGYDYKRLLRWITLSEAYGLSSREVNSGRDASSADQPELGGVALFSRFYIRQMRPEELYESLLVATHASPDRAVGIASIDQLSYTEREREKNRWLEQFAISLDTDENDEATTFDGTISQTLVMWNGDLIRKATSGERGTFLNEVAKASPPGGGANTASQGPQTNVIQDLFVAALGRNPTKPEINQARELWLRRQGNTEAALQDVWWALLNSNEFILNH